MQRRDFITAVAGAAAGWPLAALAQQSAVPVIGFLNSGSPDLDAHLVRAFGRGFGEVGYVESQDVVIDYRWPDNQYDRLPAQAAGPVPQALLARADEAVG